MCPTDPQKDPRSRKGNERFSGTSLEMEFLGSIDARDGSSELTPYASRLTPCDREVPLCSMRSALREVVYPLQLALHDLRSLGDGAG
jgi:hypothetical protein